MLCWEESMGHIRLKYLDEAGFSLWSPVSYSYIKLGEQKKIYQSNKRGKRLNLLGIYEPNKSLNYALKIGSFKKESFIIILNKEAEEAEKYRNQTGVETGIILDNYSIHKSHQVRAKEKEWAQMGLYLFFLPTYSPELNLIEGEWHQIKTAARGHSHAPDLKSGERVTHEICGRMFEDEYELVRAVKESLKNRSTQVGYRLQQWITDRNI